MANDNEVLTLYKKNDQYLQALGIADADGYPINDATVTATLTDSEGATVEPVCALPLSYIEGSDGNYLGLVPHSFDPEPGLGYTLVLAIEHGGGLQDAITRAVLVAVRHG